MKLTKKSFGGIIVLLMAAVFLAGCGSQKPEAVVNDFLKSFQKGDFEKAATYIEGNGEGTFLAAEESTVEEIDEQEFYDAIIRDYKFEKPEEVSSDGDTAKVKVNITSVDIGAAFTSTINEVMPMAFASAFNEDEDADKAMEQMVISTLIKHLTAEDAQMATRDVTLELKKDDEGNYKIVADDNLLNALLANANLLEDIFGE